MRKNFLVSSLKFSLLALLCLSMPKAVHAMCPGDPVLWHNDTIADDVIDQNIDIRGTNLLVDGIHVSAQTCDILVTVTNEDSVLTSSGQLYFSAALGRRITVCMDYDLVFRGTAVNDTLLDFLIAFTGAGELIFQLGDNGLLPPSGAQVKFTSLPTSGGAQFFNVMMPVNPTVRFERKPGSNPDLNVEVVVGDRSCISYLSSENSPLYRARIQFSPDSPTLGMMALRILPCGCYDIAGHRLNANPNTDFTLADIDLTMPFGGEAHMEVISSGIIPPAQNTSLQVINENVCCTPLNIEPFCDEQLAQNNGVQHGFILGPRGLLTVNDAHYLDYIGTATNVCCEFICDKQSRFDNVDGCDACELTSTSARLRNPSAFIVDGEADCENPASIVLNGHSGIYFRSGVDRCGMSAEANNWLINTGDTRFSRAKTPCLGNIVFDVEGPLNIVGDLDINGDVQSGVQILSLAVTKTGCPVLVAPPPQNPGPLNFPSRTFDRNNLGEYLRYNSGAMLVNNRVNWIATALVHTDQNHDVFEQGNLGNCALSSEPTYVGGDTYLLCNELCQDAVDFVRSKCRPTMRFLNSEFRVHTSVASTGVDFSVPNAGFEGNVSRFVFYNNGRCIDRGYGRNWILGTDVCFNDCCVTSTDRDSHLDVMQDNLDTVTAPQCLLLQTRFNDECIVEGAPSDDGCAVQTLYLNNGSNISVGTLGNFGTDCCLSTTFPLVTEPKLLVDGACFSFETKGGCLGYPQSSGTTGQGGIFVDTNGTFSVTRNFITNVGAMVTKSGNGSVYLPKGCVFFDSRVGIQDWQLDLRDPVSRLIVPEGETLSDYTLDWGDVTKDYCDCEGVTETVTCFLPYTIKECPEPCDCPIVTTQNVSALPCVEGTVCQFQVVRSRICDPANIKVSGPGCIQELVFLVGYNSAEAPVAVLTFESTGQGASERIPQVGLGSADVNKDSNCANIVLGVNGVQVIANGNGNICLNQDIVINNVCHFLTGPNFGQNGPQKLVVTSNVPRELRVKKGGVLDLSQFDNENKRLEISGQVVLVLEPGSRIVMNGGVLTFSDESRVELAQVLQQPLLGLNTSDLQDVRVIMSGTGRVRFEEDSSFFGQAKTIFAIQSSPECDCITSLTWGIFDQASVQIGSEEQPGGAFEVGDPNVVCTTTDICDPQEVNFQLVLNGVGAVFQVDRQGFLGLGVGITRKDSRIPNEWSVGCLNNVNRVGIDIQQGRFRHDQIASGDSQLASLIALESGGSFSFTFDPLRSQINGGGNLVQLNCEGNCPSFIQDVVPAVTDFNGLNPNGLYRSGIMAGKFLLIDTATYGPQPEGVTGTALYNYLATADYNVQVSFKRANLASDQLNIATMGYIRLGSIIERIDLVQGAIYTNGGNPTEHDHSVEIGAVNFRLSPENNIVSSVNEIIGARTN